MCGPNALVGVINVITRQRLDGDGERLSGRLTASSFGRRIADVHYLRQRGDWRVSLTGRFDRGDLDRSRSESYEWTRERYLQYRTLWGGMVERFGRYSSPHYNRALDLRLFHREAEFSLQHYSLDTHFGTVYPGDRIPILSYCSEPEWSVQLRTPLQLGERLTGAWLLRYRESGVANPCAHSVPRSVPTIRCSVLEKSSALVPCPKAERSPGQLGAVRRGAFCRWSRPG